MERQACLTRRGTGGRERLVGEGFVAAAFRHRTSRAGDPQLHTHVVVANLTRADGRFTTLDARALYHHAKTGGYLYQAALRAQVSERLGVEWEPVTKGAAEIAGIPRALVEHFSRRSAEVEAEIERTGLSSRAAHDVAVQKTRARKDYGVPVDRLRADWRSRAEECAGVGHAEGSGVHGPRGYPDDDALCPPPAPGGERGLTEPPSSRRAR